MKIHQRNKPIYSVNEIVTLLPMLEDKNDFHKLMDVIHPDLELFKSSDLNYLGLIMEKRYVEILIENGD